MTGRKAEDLTGMRFGRLVITDRVNKPGDPRGPRWASVCDCGGVTEAAASDYKRGNVRSCGCLPLEIKKARASHGESVERSREYAIWCSMKQRCGSSAHKDFKNYGARGICVSEEFRRYESFLSIMGRCPDGMSLERVDNDGPYSSGNCRWAAPLEQSNNKRNNRNLTVWGETKTMAEWARDKRCAVSYAQLKSRVGRQGWDVESALTTPTQDRHWMLGKSQGYFKKGGVK